jgi:hypothetical protein
VVDVQISIAGHKADCEIFLKVKELICYRPSTLWDPPFMMKRSKARFDRLRGRIWINRLCLTRRWQISRQRSI